jgi:serine/threonine protein kinase
MSRVLQQDIEGKTTNPIGPVCWMSPESIGQQVYSKKSDVWMFGIVGMFSLEKNSMFDQSQISIFI